MSDAVLIIHGLGANRLLMHPLARRLSAHFPRIVNWGYSSLWSRIERYAEQAAAQLEALNSDPSVERIHVVAHSMGSIVARVALQQRVPAKMGRMVMLAPPNRGSHLARRAGMFLGWLCPSLVQMSDHEQSYVARLPPLENLEVGIIAARYDIMIAEPRTHLSTEKQHIILPGLHSTIVWQRQAAERTAEFLRTGSFGQLQGR